MKRSKKDTKILKLTKKAAVIKIPQPRWYKFLMSFPKPKLSAKTQPQHKRVNPHKG